MGIILYIVSTILIISFALLGMVFTTIKGLVTLNYKLIDNYFFDLAVSNDQLGGVAMREIFNSILIKSGGYKFGHPDETISSALGRNKKMNKLSYLGKRLDALLNGLDKNHSIKSIEEYEYNNK